VLQLSHVSDSPIGDEAKRGISGGQRKRVNVGMEMVADPSLLFLDEPTSGLDSTTSYDLVFALGALAKKGCNVLTVLHQPSYPVFKMFSNVS
jgi:ABC-type multidrug transport system ATPase subunit